MKKLLLLLFFSACSSVLWAQVTVSGRVTDAGDGSGLPGVNVLEKGTSNGSVTDFDGNYTVSVSEGSTLVFSFVGYETQEVAVAGRSSINIQLSTDVTQLSEVVVVGYGTQEKKEITSAVVTLDAEDFNKGTVNDANQLLQGKVPGLSVYNKGGDPNTNAVVRLRGISTVGANSSPLVVIDGVIGASLDNLDPNDIETINVLKDGSAAAIYGSRGSAGVILVTTKTGERGKTTITYDGSVAAASIAREQNVFSASEYIANGGNDLGAVTDWQDEVTRTAVSNIHNIGISGGTETTTFRISMNYRDVEGILEKSGFEQINARGNVDHFALDNKLHVNLGFSLTNRESNFSFNEALRYAALFNPTAPIRFDNGNFFQAILFDNFNPVAIVEQNQNVGTRRTINFNLQADYSITDELKISSTIAQQYGSQFNAEFYPSTSFFRGLNRNGLARRFSEETQFTLFETFINYTKDIGNVNFAVTGGYSFQEDELSDFFIDAGNFPSNELSFNNLDDTEDEFLGGRLGDINSAASPENRIIAFFGRVNATFDNAIYFNASVRREGSSRLGEDNQWGTFPAFGVGVDINKYAGIGFFDVLKFRAGYGVTGSLPALAGQAQDRFDFDPSVTDADVTITRNANPDLKWEEKRELNIGLDFGFLDNKITGAIDVYTRTIDDFILERDVPTDLFESGRRVENVGEIKTNGAELSLNFNNIINQGDFSWTPGVVLSTYNTTLEEFIADEFVTGNLGSPGQNATPTVRVAVGEDLGQIWGPVFAGVENGNPVFADINGDGQVLAEPGDALNPDGDFEELGNGLPSLELGFTNQIRYKNFDLNLFFRGAFGHSLVNTYRAFYEPIDRGAINSYNRITSDKAVEGLENAQFSSLYVEKADFLRLDNATVGYNVTLPQGTAVSRLRVYLSVQNAFTITGYEGVDPEPVLQDFGSVDNGNRVPNITPDPLAPGIDRRNNYFTARTFTFGVNVGF